MTKYEIHDKLDIVVMTPPGEGNREMSDDEARKYQEMMEKILNCFRKDIDAKRAASGGGQIHADTQ